MSNMAIASYSSIGALTAAATNTAFTAFNVAATNPFRFSSEYAVDALGLVYYNYRHYEPMTQHTMKGHLILLKQKLSIQRIQGKDMISMMMIFDI